MRTGKHAYLTLYALNFMNLELNLVANERKQELYAKSILCSPYHYHGCQIPKRFILDLVISIGTFWHRNLSICWNGLQ